MLLITLAGCSSSGSDDPTNVGTDNANPIVSGKGMPFLYQTGYHLVSSVTTNFYDGESSFVEMISFTTDTELNTIRDDPEVNIFPDFTYDEQGKVTAFGDYLIEFDSGAEVVSYNSDGTISGYSDKSTNTAYQQFTYNNGQYESHRRGAIVDGADVIYHRTVYNTSSDGTLINARFIDLKTGEQSDLGYDYTVNQNGLVDSIQYVNFSELNLIYSIAFTYDEFNNIVKLESFGESGNLVQMKEFEYVKSSEPVPNIVGFMMITEAAFRIHL